MSWILSTAVCSFTLQVHRTGGFTYFELDGGGGCDLTSSLGAPLTPYAHRLRCCAMPTHPRCHGGHSMMAFQGSLPFRESLSLTYETTQPRQRNLVFNQLMNQKD